MEKTLQNFIDLQTPLAGLVDHRVSEAIYLSDPDGLGIEIYRDYPSDQWPIIDNTLQMGNLPFDMQGVMAELEKTPQDWEGLEKGTVLGHMHLHVGNLIEAQTFYLESIGFDLMQTFGGSASFLSTNGYHHHLGINVWNGTNIPAPPADSARMQYFTMQLPDEPARELLLKHLKETGVSTEKHELGIMVRDPSENGIVLRVNS
ncbi:MAG: hypothetical protein N2D54_09255 [Chloroflexota bacterium]